MAISLSGKSNEIVPFNSLIKNLPLQYAWTEVMFLKRCVHQNRNGDILVAVNPHMGGEQMHEGQLLRVLVFFNHFQAPHVSTTMFRIRRSLQLAAYTLRLWSAQSASSQHVSNGVAEYTIWGIISVGVFFVYSQPSDLYDPSFNWDFTANKGSAFFAMYRLFGMSKSLDILANHHWPF